LCAKRKTKRKKEEEKTRLIQRKKEMRGPDGIPLHARERGTVEEREVLRAPQKSLSKK
jgi:hypothetical protein